MRVALKIAYDGSSFHGHQRQPTHRTVEGECLAALKAARILRDPKEAFFRSASRTDRGVSAVANVIAFNATLPPEAVVGAFNDKAGDVWAWAVARVPDAFHPRHALERWYRYHLFQEVSLPRLRKAADEFVGEHDFRSFSAEPSTRPMVIDSIGVSSSDGVVQVDVRAASFRRGMVRRIVAGMLAVDHGEATLEEIRAALRGTKRDFGCAPPEPLVLMDVRYDFEFNVVLKPKVRDEWRGLADQAEFRRRFLGYLRRAAKDVEAGESL